MKTCYLLTACVFIFFWRKSPTPKVEGFFRKKYENDRMQFAKITSLNEELSGNF